MINTIVNVFALAYAVNVAVIERQSTLWAIATANFVAVLKPALFGMLADRYGRKPLFVLGAVGAGAMVFAFFHAIGTGSVPMVFASGIILIGLFYSMPNGIYPAYFPEQFPAKVRYTGMAVKPHARPAGSPASLRRSRSCSRPVTRATGFRWRGCAWLRGPVGGRRAMFGPETHRTPDRTAR